MLKAVALLSGGLDSSLAAYIVARQGVEVKGINYSTGFCTGEQSCSHVLQVEEEIAVAVELAQLPDSYLEIVKNPRFGYGSAVNPCLDCRIFMLNRAREYMEENDADFLVTGEVLGQRPMSQHRDALEIVEKESGLENLLLRPLSAKLLSPTYPEEKGWIEREELYDISGRSRKRQLELAEKFGISNYSQPAGGCCLLVEDDYAARVKDVFEYRGKKNMEREDFDLLKYGRHFRLPQGAKAVVGRDETDNRFLEGFVSGRWRLEVEQAPGPLTLVSPEADEADLTLAARLTARYSQARDEREMVVILTGESERRKMKVRPFPPEAEVIDELRIEAN